MLTSFMHNMKYELFKASFGFAIYQADGIFYEENLS